MSVPVVPIVTTNPVGWAILGTAGFLTYKAGKKAGLKDTEEIDKPGLGDRAVKGAMKTFYRTKKSLGKTLSKTSEKYASMWHDAQEEVNAGS